MPRVKKNTSPLSLSLDFSDNQSNQQNNQQSNQNLSEAELEEMVAALKPNPNSDSKKNNNNLVEETPSQQVADKYANLYNGNKNNPKNPEKISRSRNYDESVNQLHIYHRNQKDVKVPKVLSLIEQLQNLIPTGRFKIQTEEVKRAKEAKKAERAARREEKEKQALRAKSEKITAELDGRILPKAPPKVPKKREKKDKDKNKK